jgi:hypothetical protein
VSDNGKTAPGVAFLAVAGLGVGFAVAPPSARAAFQLLTWRLTTGVVDSSGSSTVVDGHSFESVQNPFQGPGAVSDTSVGPNTARSEYDFSWVLNTGSFHIDIDHHVETTDVDTTSSGHFLIQPDVDLRLTIDASLDYTSVPGDLADFILRMFVRDEATEITLFNEAEEGGSLWFHPASGTLDFDGEVILPATGTTYRIDYRAWASTLAEDNPSGPLTSSGYVHFDLAPVPEPATALLCLVAGAPLALKRRHSRCEG